MAVEQWAKDVNRHLMREDIQKVIKHRDMHSASSARKSKLR